MRRWPRGGSSAGCARPPDWHLYLGVGLLYLLEHRRLEDAQPDVQADPKDDDAQEERYAPTPGQELLLRERREQRESSRREQEPYRDPCARKAREESAPSHGGVLRSHDHRAAELRAGTEALEDTQQEEQDRAQIPMLSKVGKRPMRVVATPISIRVITSIALRPILSP